MDSKLVDIQAKPPRKWVTAAMWVLIGAAMVALFGHNIAEMWVRWFPAWQYGGSLYDRIVGGESYYTHAPLVPFVSLVIVLLLARHTRIPVAPSRTLGGVVLLLALAVHLAASLARVNFISGFAMIFVLAGLVLLFWGLEALKRLWFPLAFLFFMIPLPDLTIKNLNFDLKMLATRWGVAAADFLGIVVVRTGNRVFLEGDKTLVVANVCNGLRTIISVLAFGALYAYVCRLKGFWRVGLFAMSIPVAVVSNAIRIVSLIAVADIWDESVATGWFHDLSGMLIFVLAFLMLFGIERLVLWVREAVGRPAEIRQLFAGEIRTADDQGQGARLIRALTLRAALPLTVVLLAVSAGAWHLSQARQSSGMGLKAGNAVPKQLKIDGKQWFGTDLQLDEETLVILETRDYMNRQYQCPGLTPMYMAIVFSEDNRKGTHPPDVCLEGAGEGIVGKADVVVSDVPNRGDVQCRELLVQESDRGRTYYLYTYKCGNEYTNSFWWQQLTIFYNGLMDANSSGALIRVSTYVGDGDWAPARQRAISFMQTAIPHLDRSLP